MIKHFIHITSLLLLVVIIGCGSASNENQKVRPMVYEGMSTIDLQGVLGEPELIDSVSAIYLPDFGKTVAVEKWIYEKRTVLVIHDTIKNPDFKD